MRSVRKILAVLSVVSLMAGPALLAQPAMARDKGDLENTEGIFKIRYPTLKVSKEYAPPSSGSGNNGTALNNPVQCRKVEYCDLIRVEVDPNGAQEKEAFYLELTLEWANHCIQPTKENPTTTCPATAVNLNMHMWEPDFDCHDDPVTPNDDCKEPDGTQVSILLGRNLSTTLHPEKFKFGADIQTPSFFYLIIANITQGANPDPISPMKITAEFKFASFDDYSPPEEKPTGIQSTGKKSSGSTGLKPSTAPKPTLSPVKVPGADGPLSEQTLIAFAGERKEGEQQKSSPLVMGVIGLAVLGAATFGFFFIRGRRIPSS